jgi:hypothetical protein
MASSRFLISSQTLASSAASVTFSSIPATYTDLVIRCSVRTLASATDDYCQINFNSDTSTLYSRTFLFGDGSAAYSQRGSNQGAIYNVYAFNGDTSTANTFSNTEIYIPSYTASQSKPLSSSSVQENNTANSYDYIGAYANLYRSNTAISSIAITSSANLKTGSSFYLYGIKNS